MGAKGYRAMRRAQGKMLREYFSGVSVESLSRRYGYSVIKIKTMASDYKQGKIDIFVSSCVCCVPSAVKCYCCTIYQLPMGKYLMV